jgi:hypothetical protein
VKKPRKFVRQLWSAEEIERLRIVYPDASAAELVRQFKRPLRKILHSAQRYGIHRSPAFMAALHAEQGRRLAQTGVGNRFKPGEAPHNKGQRRPGWSVGRMRETQFKPGQMPHNHLPVGTLKFNADGYLRLKVSDIPKNGTGGNDKNWVFVHRKVWEDAHGPIPKGWRIWWKDGDHGNCALENLELVAGRDHMMRTSIHTLLPKPLAEAMAIRNAVMAQIGRIEKKKGILHGEKQDFGPARSSLRDARAAQG